MNINIYNPYVHDELMHHGILGQKYGKRMGPPYPLAPGDHSAAEKKAGWQVSLKNGSPVMKKVGTGKELPTLASPAKTSSSGGGKSSSSKDGRKYSEIHRHSIKGKKSSGSDGNGSGTKMKTLEELKAGGTSKKSKKGKGKSSGSKKTKEQTKEQATEIEMPTNINIKRKKYATYSVDTKLGTRTIGSGSGNVQMTDMKGQAVQGPNGGGTVLGGKEMSGRLILTKEQSDREYATEFEQVIKKYRKAAAIKLMKANLKSSEVSEKVQKGKEIADKVLKKSK